jgi:ABC-type amino acid transport substrate-binding protein
VLGVHSKTAPLEWRNNGVDQGFNIELMDRIGQLTNKRILVRRKSFQQLVQDVYNPNSDIDVIVVVSPVNMDRKLAQSDPIYATHAKAYTLQGKGLINSWADLIGKRVAIKKVLLLMFFYLIICKTLIAWMLICMKPVFNY